MRRNWIEGKDDKSMYMYSCTQNRKHIHTLYTPTVDALVTFFYWENQQKIQMAKRRNTV